MIDHTSRNTNTGKLYRASTEHLILEVGMGQELLDLPYSELGFLGTDSIVKSTWKFLSQHNLRLKHDITIDLPREFDRPIMTAFFTAGYRDVEIAAINRCRLFLQVYSMADIIAMDGRTVKLHILQGTKGPRLNNFQWPTQGNPSRPD